MTPFTRVLPYRYALNVLFVWITSISVHPTDADDSSTAPMRSYIVKCKDYISPPFRREWSSLGVRFVQYCPPAAYLVYCSESSAESLRRMSEIESVSPPGTRFKVDEELIHCADALRMTKTLGKAAEERQTVKVSFMPTTGFMEADELLQSYEAEYEKEKTDFDYLETIDRVSIPIHLIHALSSETLVFLISEIDSPLRFNNLNAQYTSQIHRIRSMGLDNQLLDGFGIAVGLWDGTVRTSHNDLEGRAFQQDYKGLPRRHGTHVAGTIAGNGSLNPHAEGMAPRATLLCWDTGIDLREMDTDGHRIIASNHSYTASVGWEYDENTNQWHWYGTRYIEALESRYFGLYNERTRAFDRIAHDRDYSMVVAAGNNRTDTAPPVNVAYTLNDSSVQSTKPRLDDGWEVGGFDTLNPMAVGKNVITVGAIQDWLDREKPLTGSMLAAFSSWGPTDDGRIKPDLVANGVGLISLDSESDTGYWAMSGTSMAAPVVTGAIACLAQAIQQRFDGALPSAHLIKNILIHTAHDDADFPGPDYHFGWGALDGEHAAEFIRSANRGITRSSWVH